LQSGLESKGPKFTEVEPNQDDDGIDTPILKPVNLYSDFRHSRERQVFNQVRDQFRKMLKNSKGVTTEQSDAMAMFQFRHMRFRAEVVNMDIQEYMDGINFGEMTRENYKNFDRAGGVFTRSPIKHRIWDILVRNDTKLSTTLHELGHSWLYEMAADKKYVFGISEEALTSSQREYKKTIEMVEKLFEIEDLNDLESGKMDMAERKRVHESFAQTTERYFLDGDVEGNPFRTVMEAFRTWLSKIRGLVGNSYADEGIFPLEINDDVRRLFRTLLDVEVATDKYLTPAFPEISIPENILGADSQRVYEAYKDSLDKAIAEVFGKAYERTYREHLKIYNAKIDGILQRATEQVDALPEMQMLQVFRSSYAQWKENGKKGSDPRISFDSLVSEVFNGDVKAATEFKKGLDRDLITGQKKRGLDFNVAMAMFGATDKGQFVQALETASKRGEMITSQADRIFNAENPIMKSDEQIRQIAEKAANDYGRDKILRMELDILIKEDPSAFKKAVARIAKDASYLVNNENRDFVKDRAYKIVTESKDKAFRAKNFIDVANTHSKRAANLLVKGDIIAATDAKLEEAIYFEAFRLATKIEKKLANYRVLLKRMKRLNPNKLGKTHDVDLVSYAKILAEAYFEGDQSVPRFDKEIMLNPDNISDSRVNSINDMINAFNESTGNKDGIGMTLENMLYLSSAVESSLDAARKSKLVEIGDQKREVEDVAVASAESISAKKTTPARGIIYQLTNVRTLFESVLKKGEAATSPLIALLDEVAEAEAEFQDKYTAAKVKVNSAIKKAFKNEKDKGLKKIWAPIARRVPESLLPIGIRRLVVEPIASKELGFTFNNMGEVLVFFMYMGSESSSQAILGSGVDGANNSLTNFNPALGKFDEAPVWALLERLIEEGKITRDHLDILEAVWEGFSGVYNKASSTVRDIDGVNMGFVEGRIIKTSLGEIKGSYVPLMQAKSSQINKKAETVFQANVDGKVINKLNPLQNLGFTKNRVMRNAPLSLDFSKIAFHMANEFKVAYMRKPMHMVGKVLQHPELKGKLESVSPDIYEKALIPWFERTLAQEHVKRSDSGGRDAIDSSAAFIRSNIYKVAFLGNPTSVAKQTIGLSPAALELGEKRAAMAAMRMISNPKGNRQKVESMSRRMQVRFRANEQNNIKSVEILETNVDWISAAGELSETATFLPIQLAQNTLDAAVWLEAYDKAIEEGMTENEAKRYSDNVVIKTQGSSDVSELQKIRYGSDLKKLITGMFSMVPTSMFQMQYIAFRRRGFDDAKAKYFGKAFFLASLMPAVLALLITEAWDGLTGEEDEKEKKRRLNNPDKYRAEEFQRMALRVGSEVFDNTFPIIGSVGSIFIGEDVGPLPRVAKTAKRAKDAISRKFQGVDATSRDIEAILDTLTLMSGLPFNILNLGVSLSDQLKSDAAKERDSRQRQRQLEEARRED